MRSLLRSLSLVVLVALLAATAGACGKPKAVARRVHEPGGVAPPKDTDAPDAQTVGNAIAPYDAYGTEVADGLFPRTVSHHLGDTVLEARPQRIVTLDIGELDTVLRLDVTPVGMVAAGPGGLPPYVDDGALDGVTEVGPVEAPDLTAIAALQPDLILSNTQRHEALYDQLSQIAPTVFGDRIDVAWRRNAELIADALGLEREERSVEERYKQRVAEVAASLPRPKPKLSVIRILPSTLRIYNRSNFVAMVLTDLGIIRPRHQNYDQAWVDTTLDNVPHAAGDAILVIADETGRSIFDDEVADTESWKALPAVERGRVRVVEPRIWADGRSYGAALTLLDQLEKLYEDPELRD